MFKKKRHEEGTVDVIFGIGFKIGFLVVLMGLVLAYIPLIQRNVEITLDYIGFWDAFRTLPAWLQLIFTGFVLMGVAVVLSVFRGNVEDFINLLFYKDRYY
jgi:hypothetical protein